MMHIGKGLDVPISGVPAPRIDETRGLEQHVALSGRDYVGLKPKMLVREGDKVEQGQPLFADKTYPEIVFTAPATGTVQQINRGAKRFLESVVLKIDHAAEDKGKRAKYDSYDLEQIGKLKRADVQKALLKSGLWPQIRTRPYSRLADPSATPKAFFVNLMDTNPLALDPGLVVSNREQDLIAGITAVSTLTEGSIYLCKSPTLTLPEAVTGLPRVTVTDFSGPHPSGLVGTHIHFLEPVTAETQVWHVDAQDVLAFGSLLLSGRYPTELIVALGGPMAKNPRMLKTRRGACVSELIEEEVSYARWSGVRDDIRAVAGSLFTGRAARGFHDYLGAFHRQIVLIEEYGPRRLLGWLVPGLDRFSTARVHLSALALPKLFNMSANANGSPRAMVSFGQYEEVMPLDILATQLLKALLVMDTDMAQLLGALELDEEDLGLCSYVCLSKYEYGVALRETLTRIEQEG